MGTVVLPVFCSPIYCDTLLGRFEGDRLFLEGCDLVAKSVLSEAVSSELINILPLELLVALLLLSF